jgi:hypothetical protein
MAKFIIHACIDDQDYAGGFSDKICRSFQAPKFNFSLPKIEPPPVELPKVEAPKIELPKVEAPKLELPKVEAPKFDMPKFEAPKLEAPKVSKCATIPHTCIIKGG